MKSRYTLLTDVNKVVKQNRDFNFSYADINCQLKSKSAEEAITDKNSFLDGWIAGNSRLSLNADNELQEILGNH